VVSERYMAPIQSDTFILVLFYFIFLFCSLLLLFGFLFG